MARTRYIALDYRAIGPILVCLLTLAGVPAFAQQDQVPILSLSGPLQDTLEIHAFTKVWIDDRAESDFADARRMEADFVPLTGVSTKKALYQNIWLSFRIRNEGSDTLDLYYAGKMKLKNTFWDLATQDSFQSGLLIPINQRSSRCYKDFFHIQIPPEETRTYLVRLENFAWKARGFGSIIYSRARYIENNSQSFRKALSGIVISTAIVSITLFLCIFFLFQYAHNRDPLYLYYSLYLLLMFFRFFLSMEANQDIQVLFAHAGMANLYFDLILDIVPIFFYASFVRHFLSLDQKAPRTYRKIKIFIGILMCLLAASILFLMLNMPLARRSMHMVSLTTMSVGSLWFIYILYKNRSAPFAKYILWGSALLALGVGITSVGAFSLKHQMSSPLLPMRIGYLLELFFFSYSLGLRSSLIEKEFDLENKQLLRNKQEIESQLQETEIKALKAQINPHFIFNCLNSIKALIQENEREKAIEYLIKFAKLIRAVVDYSLQTEITLQKELQISEWYIEMESLRTENPFAYELQFEGDYIDMDYITVPPFLFQPFLENAIWHGLEPQTDKQPQLKIILKIEANHLICIIDDNGIGREEAGKRNNPKQEQSIGLRNMEERFTLIQKARDLHIEFDIIDKYDRAHVPTGTRIELRIPI